MNFYPFHIGDYASATAHLSILEDGVYRRLLDCYYTREEPLPVDVRQCCRLVRAQSPDERQAVDDVLREFFELTPHGWRHSRCDDELAHFVAKREKARASGLAGVAARRRSLSERSPNGQRNGDHSLDESIPNAGVINSDRSESESDRLATKTKTKTKKEKDTRGANAPIVGLEGLKADGVPEDVAQAFLAVRKGKNAGPLTTIAWDGIKREAAKAGWTLAVAVRESVERNWTAFRADWVVHRSPSGSQGTFATAAGGWRSGSI